MSTNLLLVTPPEKRAEMERLLESGEWEVHAATSLPELHRELTSPRFFDVALIDMDFEDRSWNDLMDMITNVEQSCAVIVCCSQAEEQQWAEVVGYGAYDLLVEPYEEQEVLRVVRSALTRLNMHRLAHLKAS